jgi:hypothetical protein
MRLLKLLFLLLLPLFFISCDPDGDITPKTGKLNVQLVDAPFEYDLVAEANVTVFKVEIREAGEDEDGGFLTLTEEEFQVNLLELTNGVSETLFSNEIPVGEYDQIRVYVKDASVVLTDGTVYDLKVPSGEQTGIKVSVDPAIRVAGGLTADLLLDFDVSQSFVARGNIGKPNFNGFIFKPTIKGVNLSTAGTFAGIVNIPDDKDNPVIVEGAQIDILDGDVVISSTFTDVTGEFTFLGVQSGTYTVWIQKEGYLTTVLESVDIVEGNVTSINVTLEPVDKSGV